MSSIPFDEFSGKNVIKQFHQMVEGIFQDPEVAHIVSKILLPEQRIESIDVIVVPEQSEEGQKIGSGAVFPVSFKESGRMGLGKNGSKELKAYLVEKVGEIAGRILGVTKSFSLKIPKNIKIRVNESMRRVEIEEGDVMVLGEPLKNIGIFRNQVFLTSKNETTDFSPEQFKGIFGDVEWKK